MLPVLTIKGKICKQRINIFKCIVSASLGSFNVTLAIVESSKLSPELNVFRFCQVGLHSIFIVLT